MRALGKGNNDLLYRSRHLIERNAGRPRRPQGGSDRVSVLANPEANDRLDSWKEIASHLKRTVRTVQRWEKHEGLPVHRHLHVRAKSVYARKSEVDEWWNREARTNEIRPLKLSAEGSRREVMKPQVSSVSNSERDCREAYPTPSEWLVEQVLELPEVEICSFNDGTGHVVFVVRARICIREFLLQSVKGRVTRGAKASCRSLSLAASERRGHSADIRDKDQKSVFWRN